MNTGGGLGVPGEPFSDWPLAAVAPVGGIGGALIGATAAADAGAACPLTWALLGAMLGSGLCAVAWGWLEGRVWAGAGE